MSVSVRPAVGCQAVSIFIVALFILFGWVLPVSAFDPMAPPGYERGNIDSYSRNKKPPPKKRVRVQGGDFVLRQIVIHDQSKSAVINGYILNEGSHLKGAYVYAINHNSVELIVAGKKRVLTLEITLPKIRR